MCVCVCAFVCVRLFKGLRRSLAFVQCSIIINDTFDTIWAAVVKDLVSAVYIMCSLVCINWNLNVFLTERLNPSVCILGEVY